MSVREAIYGSSVLAAIGDTPLVALDRFTAGMDGRILAKLEYLNPGHSKKDRIALQIIEDAEISGDLKPGQNVIELTSGNTGTGAAIVCAVKGYKFTAVMSEGNSIERARMMTALGAEVILVPQAVGSKANAVSGADLDLVEAQTQALVAERSGFRIDQFQRQGSIRAHLLRTGPEILRQSEGSVTAFCDFVGSGGSFAGISMCLKAQNPSVKCYVVEPSSAAVIAGEPIEDSRHRIQGGGYSMHQLPFLSGIKPDGFLKVTDEEAIQASRDLARYEGLFAGFSAGANAAAALKLLNGPERGGTIAILLCDSGMKYLSTDLWE